MLPVVTEVVLVAELRLLTLDHLAQLVPPLVGHLGTVIWVRLAVRLAADDELVQVGVGPAHDHLENLVQLGEADVGGDLDSPPDRRLAVHERDLDLVYFWHVRCSDERPLMRYTPWFGRQRYPATVGFVSALAFRGQGGCPA